MKKTTLTILFASVMMLALIGCGTKKVEAASDPCEEEFQTEAAETEAIGETPVALSDDSFAYNGKIISVKDDLQTILDNLGAGEGRPSDQEGVICYDIGTGAVSVFTKETDGKEELTQITVHDKTARTAKGVGVGSTEDEVRNAYGEPNDEVVEGAKLLTYEFEGYSILFAFNDNVAAISYFISK